MKYNNFYNCSIAKEMWDAIRENRSINEMFGRFQKILNRLKSLGTEFSRAYNNLKILENLSKIWEPKGTTISEIGDLKLLTLNELFGPLSYEVHLNKKNHLKASDTIALRVGETNKRREK
uniref:Uncharacterized protein n=1 Tax=Cajanus cajan TaxID=3821 RepID=A0A151SMB3_CAJCA|nr:hypothetical protein KK1_002140 [Cajanus cajan]